MASSNDSNIARDGLPPGVLIDSYKILRTIGKGGFSLIYLAVDEESGRGVAIPLSADS